VTGEVQRRNPNYCCLGSCEDKITTKWYCACIALTSNAFENKCTPPTKASPEPHSSRTYVPISRTEEHDDNYSNFMSDFEAGNRFRGV
jgi:hypothetical protein